MRYARAFSTLGCPDVTLPGAWTLASRFGLDALELRALGGTFDLPEYLRRTEGAPEALARRMAGGGGGRVAAIDTGWRMVGGTEADRAKFLEFVPWAEALGARWMRVFEGGPDAAGAGLPAAAEAARWWRKVRAERGWKADIMIETHDSMLNGAALRRFAAAVPGVAILWDAFNTWIKSGEDPAVTWREIRAAGLTVPHLHVKDGIRRPWGPYGHTMTLPGDGEFPMGRLLPELREHFEGVVSLEWEKHWHPYLPPLEEALRSAAAKKWW